MRTALLLFNMRVFHSQPLRTLIDDDLWDKVLRVINGKEQMESILNNYYDKQKKK